MSTQVKLLAVLSAAAILAATPENVLARTRVNSYMITAATPSPTASPTPTPAPEANSFELFWPMAAGKTMQSKIYFLKTLKEKIRGFFIFGSIQKANYDIFLGIKRMLESEVLLKANLGDLANKTLDSAVYDFDKASSAVTNAKNSGDIDQSSKDEINIRVSNLKKLVISMLAKNPNYKDKLQNILDKLNSITL